MHSTLLREPYELRVGPALAQKEHWLANTLLQSCLDMSVHPCRAVSHLQVWNHSLGDRQSLTDLCEHRENAHVLGAGSTDSLASKVADPLHSRLQVLEQPLKLCLLVEKDLHDICGTYMLTRGFGSKPRCTLWCDV